MRVFLIFTIALLLSCSKKIISEFGWEVIAPLKSDILKDLAKRNSNLIIINNDFLIEKTEVTNKDYYTFIKSIYSIYGKDSILNLLPNLNNELIYDTILEMNIAKKLVLSRFEYLPVVAITYENANSYCKWKTNYQEYHILIKEGILNLSKNEDEDIQNLSFPFINSYKSYYLLQNSKINEKKINLNCCNEFRKVRIEEGLSFPNYKLPSKEQWLKSLNADLDTSSYPIGKLKPSYFGRKIDSSKIVCNNKIRNGPNNVNLTYQNHLGINGLLDNVSEYTIDKGIAMGGNFLEKLPELTNKLPFKYSNPQQNIGFRCVVTLKHSNFWTNNRFY